MEHGGLKVASIPVSSGWWLVEDWAGYSHGLLWLWQHRVGVFLSDCVTWEAQWQYEPLNLPLEWLYKNLF